MVDYASAEDNIVSKLQVGGLIDIALNVIALVIIIALMIVIKRNKRKILENKLFFSMCVSCALIAVTEISRLLLYSGVAPEDWNLPIKILELTLYWIPELLSLLVVVQWLLYVEFSLHQSVDVIRRRYTVRMIPGIVAVLMIFTNLGIDIVNQLSENHSQLLVNIYTIFGLVSSFIIMVYLFNSYSIVYKEKKRKKIPRFVSLTPTVICILAGYIIKNVTGLFSLALGFALGLVFMAYSLRKRFSQEDADTGYYNSNYLSVITDYMKKSGMKGGTIVRFVTTGDSTKLAELLHDMEPDNSKTIFMGNGTFLVFSETQREDVLRWYISAVLEEAESIGLEVEEEHKTRKDETADEFFAQFMN